MKKILFLLSISLIFLFLACKKSDPGPLHYFVLPEDSACAPFTLDSFPLQPGHVWAYDNGDTMRTVSDTIINGVKTTKLSISNDADYYLQNIQGGTKSVSRSENSRFGSTWLGDLYLYNIYDTSGKAILGMQMLNVLLMKYPIIVNDTFSSGKTYYRPTDQLESTWVGFRKIMTPAGIFDCTVLKVEGGYAPSWYFYFSNKGLVRMISVITVGSKTKENPGFSFSVCNLISVNF